MAAVVPANIKLEVRAEPTRIHSDVWRGHASRPCWQNIYIFLIDTAENSSKISPDYPSPQGGVNRKGRKMDAKKKTDTLRRLKSVEGHIRGVEKMIEDDAYCIDVIGQIQAIQAALNKVKANILDNHLHDCVITAVRGEDPKERERVLSEIAEVFETATKV